MSTLRANSIEHTDGGPIALTKQSCIIAYAQFDQDASGHPVGVSFNIASTTDKGTGLTSWNYTNNVSLANHAITVADNGWNESGSATGITSDSQGTDADHRKRTSGGGVDARNYNSSNRDKDDVSIMSAGALA